MRKLLITLLILSPLALAGCFQSATLTEEDKALPEASTQTSFDRESVDIDFENSYLSFTGTKGENISHQCEFESYDVSIILDEAEPSNLEKASISVDIDIDSLVTENAGLTKHLLSDDFFGAEEHPQATFDSTSITHQQGNDYVVAGDLTLKGTTQSISFAAEITNDYATLKYDLNSHNFGVGNDAGTNAIAPLEAKLMFQ